ncbi:MAG: carboxysome shell protein [Thioalkalivibrio sp.]|nr:MAG: carboxysome shell protein [Thioalkalivibrio sp.]
MPQAEDSKASATLSGRELALKRRKAMALHGKSAFVKKAAATQGASSRRAPSATSTGTTSRSAAEATKHVEAGVHAGASNGRQRAQARREAMSRRGKAATSQPASSRPSGRMRPNPTDAAQQIPASSQKASTRQAGDCGCKDEPCDCQESGARPATEPRESASASPRPAASAPRMPGANMPKGRAIARARREALSRNGKAGLVRATHLARAAAVMQDQDWQSAIAGERPSGRQIAMQRRKVRALAGKAGSTPSGKASRPSGRQRVRLDIPAPPKVEEGHTLSGQSVSGTMVEGTKKLTGVEAGACRGITGTEYIGAELYDQQCPTRPDTGPTKVGVSTTTREHKVTGTEVGRSRQVTGDETGACRGITGTEYLAVERYEEFCETRPQPASEKVGMSETTRGQSVTGTMVGRSPRVTGDEPGSDRAVTGTGYGQPAADTAPDKVALTHTVSGGTITGSSVGQSRRVTGDEPGACRGVTGTEYLSAEQFKEVCSTTPPDTPRKVSVMLTRGDQSVSGTEVGRSSRVTGDEPGSCRDITGNQYYTASDFGDLCNVGGPRKVGDMKTVSGGRVTGTEVLRNPKMSGDDKGGCKPITGTDYVSADQLQAVCATSTPVSAVDKVAVDQTWRGQSITGSPVGRGPRVTGDESGGCSPISGTPYIGRSQYGAFCPEPASAQQEMLMPSDALIPAQAVTGDRPGAGGSVMTGDERGACEAVSGTPYVGVDNVMPQCATSGRFLQRARTWEEPPRPPAPADFSIRSPARAAQERQFEEVTGTGYTSERITGPVNKATGLITGTPEFRHRDAGTLQQEQEEVITAASRLTGEGSQAGTRITGDAWDAASRVTGTEGASSLGRNVSQRGQPRGEGINARRFREAEHPEVPESRITGSSGNTGGGALVTLSGGARG